MRGHGSQWMAPRTTEKMKILGALWELPAKQHCQSSPFTSKLGLYWGKWSGLAVLVQTWKKYAGFTYLSMFWKEFLTHPPSPVLTYKHWYIHFKSTQPSLRRQCHAWVHLSRYVHYPNVSTTPITAMGCRQCLPLSII